MDEATTRYALPLLQAGQVQKEVLHNEALLLIDLLMNAVCESCGDDDPPASPAVGQSWVIGAAPTGEWAAQAHALANWSTAGWRFIPAVEGLTVRVRSSGTEIVFRSGAWSDGTLVAAGVAIGGTRVIGQQRPPIASPAGGGTIDAEARAAIAAVLGALRSHGLIAV